MRRGLAAVVGLRRGSLALVFFRVLSLLLLSAPPWSALRAAIDAGPGRLPLAGQHAGPLPMGVVVGLLRDAGDSAWIVAALFALLFALVDWVLTAVASELLGSPSRPPPKVSRLVSIGGSLVGVYARIALLSGCALALGFAGLFFGYEWVSAFGARRGVSATAELVAFPALGAALALLWSVSVGAFALVGRVLCVTAQERGALAALRGALRFAASTPGLLPPLIGLSLLPQLGGAGLLGCFYPPAFEARFVVAWVAFLVVQAYLWHVRVAWVCALHAVYTDRR